MLELLCEWHRRQEVTGERARDLTRENTVQEDIIREPVELIDEDLDAVAGGFAINVDVNVAEIEQTIVQAQETVFGSNSATAAQVAAISQTA
jgi:hypothetical protein